VVIQLGSNSLKTTHRGVANHLYLYIFLCITRSIEEIVRALMYAGFEVVQKGILSYHADDKYFVLGMEL
jgi:hypothetical protein